MPSGAGRDRITAAVAAAEPFADLGDRQGLRQQIDVDVSGRPQFAQAAVTARTPFKRMLASVIGSKPRITVHP